MGGVPEQWEVKSGDGGSIAVWVEGDGPPLVLVHGSVSDHAAFAPLVGELRDEFTIFAMDRRGFGASRDGPNYSAEVQRCRGGRGAELYSHDGCYAATRRWSVAAVGITPFGRLIV
jgi:pimeloyl-ACP methyl ester carboxylesterase